MITKIIPMKNIGILYYSTIIFRCFPFLNQCKEIRFLQQKLLLLYLFIEQILIYIRLPLLSNVLTCDMPDGESLGIEPVDTFA